MAVGEQIVRGDAVAPGVVNFEALELALGKDLPDPYPLFKRVRRDGPVYRGDILREEFGYSSPMAPMLEAGSRPVVTAVGYDAVTAVMRDAERFSNEVYGASVGVAFGKNILMMDGKEHRSKRRLLQHAFTRGDIERWRSTVVVPVVNGLIDQFAGQGHADLVREFSLSIPARVLHAIPGLPPEQFDDFYRWTNELLCIEFDPEVGMAASASIGAHIASVLEQRRSHPRKDVISVLLAAEEDGVALPEEDILGNLRLLLPAGSETTARLIGTLFAAMLTHPEQLALVQKDRSLIPVAVEEAIRWDGPVHLSNRTCLVDTCVGGVDIPKGASVITALGSANRDESIYDEADRFDITRKRSAPHLGFGNGPHMCLGLNLARVEAAVALETVLDRLPRLRLDPDQATPQITGIAFRGPISVPVLWD